jgi:hypothetical protein
VGVPFQNCDNLHEVGVGKDYKELAMRIGGCLSAVKVITTLRDHEQQWIDELSAVRGCARTHAAGPRIAPSPVGFSASFFQGDPFDSCIQREDLLS